MSTERADAPLDLADLSRALVTQDGLWRAVTVVESTGSTNADLLTQAAGGAPEGTVLVAETQTAGRGRMGRSWVSSARGGALTFSVLLRPARVAVARRGWIPLLAGLATAAAVQALTGLDAQLKWPNDVLVDGGKLAGILTEQAGDAVVAGLGINVSATRAELPVDTATSLAVAGAPGVGRGDLLRAVLTGIERRYLAWAGTPTPGDAEASGLRAEYRGRCATLGREVRVDFPDGTSTQATAVDADAGGQLLLRTADGPRAVSAGDVLHLR